VSVYVGVGFWLYFWLGKKAAVRELEFKGDFYATMWTEAEVRKGLEYYNRAVALDPHSASAYDGLATGWNLLSDLHVSPREAQPKAKAAALKALQLDEAYAPAHVSLGVIKMQYEWDRAGAEQEFKRAIALAPEYTPAHHLYGWDLIAVGRFDEAEAEMRWAAEANPLADINLWGLGLCLYFEGQYDEAIEQYRRAIGVEPRSYWAHMLLGWAYIQQGKHPEALAALKEANRINDGPQTLASLGHAYAVAGRRVEAQKVIKELEERARQRYISPYDVATIYAGLGDAEQALSWLEKAYEDRSGWLGLWLKVDPKFDRLRRDPRFQDLLRRVGHAP
jgi:tetratricopeptide (TPR) repeat protein